MARPASPWSSSWRCIARMRGRRAARSTGPARGSRWPCRASSQGATTSSCWPPGTSSSASRRPTLWRSGARPHSTGTSGCARSGPCRWTGPCPLRSRRPCPRSWKRVVPAGRALRCFWRGRRSRPLATAAASWSSRAVARSTSTRCWGGGRCSGCACGWTAPTTWPRWTCRFRAADSGGATAPGPSPAPPATCASRTCPPPGRRPPRCSARPAPCGPGCARGSPGSSSAPRPRSACGIAAWAAPPGAPRGGARWTCRRSAMGRRAACCWRRCSGRSTGWCRASPTRSACSSSRIAGAARGGPRSPRPCSSASPSPSPPTWPPPSSQ
mmetsp:Transcript_75018/g.202837  ORF Transcript_75018/g.202837 Transcript_75018/m.202837 type:complete len:326 (-) Transcript_75018:388-1365(-)